MRFRKLRIAWSMFWGLACVLLIVLWVRSYWWNERILVGLCNRAFQASHVLGRLQLQCVNAPSTSFWATCGRFPVDTWRRDPAYALDRSMPRFGFLWKTTE